MLITFWWYSLSSEGGSQQTQKRDVRQLVAVIPPASEVLSKGMKRVLERRVRVRLKDEVPEGVLWIARRLADELGIKESAQLSVSGKKLVLKALASEELPENEVWANEGFMRRNGVADNSMATVRSV